MYLYKNYRINLLKFIVSILSTCLIMINISGCSWFNAYHMDIQQGNKISAKQIEKIHTGMTQREVIKILGQPIQQDALVTDRLDYTYTKQIKNQEINIQQLTLLFEHNKLTKIIRHDYNNKT